MNELTLVSCIHLFLLFLPLLPSSLYGDFERNGPSGDVTIECVKDD